MILNVPLLLQKEGSGDCGLVSAQMIFGYYGITKTLSEIKKEIKLHPIGDGNFGSYSPQWASIFLNYGFSVVITTLHPKLFTKHDHNLSQKSIRSRLEESREKYKTKGDKLAIKYFLEFMDKGGKINIEIPSIDNLKNEIKEKRPVIINYTSNFINGKSPKMNFHAAVAVGIDRDFIYVNDSLPDNRGGLKKYSYQDFLFGTYGSLAGDLDNTVQIAIKKN